MASQFIQAGLGHTLISFDGRIQRQPYWVFCIGIPMVVIAAYMATSEWVTKQQFGGAGVADGVLQAVNVVFTLVFFTAYVWVFFAGTVKRLHDRNMSGWWVWLFLIPYVGLLALVVICALPGTVGTNRFDEAESAGSDG